MVMSATTCERVGVKQLNTLNMHLDGDVRHDLHVWQQLNQVQRYAQLVDHVTRVHLDGDECHNLCA